MTEEKLVIRDRFLQFDIPPVNFFTQGNCYSGSSHSYFRYKVRPIDGCFVCDVWHNPKAFDCISEDDLEATERFPLNEDGRTEMLGWFEKRFAEFKEKYPEYAEKDYVRVKF